MTTVQEPASARDLAVDLSRYKLGWSDDIDYAYRPEKGLSEAVIRNISAIKGEPEWMLKQRLTGLRNFTRRPLPQWGPDLSIVDFDDIYYYVRPTGEQVDEWDALPDKIKATYERLGIPEAERKYLAGVTAQFDSDVVMHRNRAELEAQGVLFCDMDTAIRDYPDLVHKWFGKIISPNDNKLAALNTAAMSGGSFIFVPPGVKVEQPLQAYFRINSQNMGQFERTLIIADEGSDVTYLEGCFEEKTPVTMADGSRLNIEEVALGDYVQGLDGPVMVTGVMRRDHDGTLHTITTTSPANAITCTEEHPLLAVRRATVRTGRAARNGWKEEISTEKLRDAAPEWVRADELSPGDFLVYPVPTYAGTSTVQLDPELCRLAGYWLAKGSSGLSNGYKALSWCFHENEMDYVTEVQDLCETLWGKRGSVHHQPEKHAVVVDVYTDAGYDFMRGNIGTRSWNKMLSPLLLGQSEDRLVALVDAYLNSDGCITARGERSSVRTNTTSYEWALQLQQLMFVQGVFATVALDRAGGPGETLGRAIVRHDLWKIQWTVGKTSSKVHVRDGLAFLSIEKIDVTPHLGEVFNIETADNTYVVNGYAVHNCSAPSYSSDSLHAAVVEIAVGKGAKVTYTTIQNWAGNIFNLVTKRARVEAEGQMTWVDANNGSQLTMKYPAVYLVGPKARGEVISVAVAGPGQYQDTGAKMVHAAPETTSRVVAKSISLGGGKTAYRGLVRVEPDAHGCKSHVQCDAMLLDELSTSDTYPTIEAGSRDAQIGHEATVSKVGEDQLFYLMSRGLSQQQAMGLLVNGFVEPVSRLLPMEYAVEWSRLIELQLEDSVG